MAKSRFQNETVFLYKGPDTYKYEQYYEYNDGMINVPIVSNLRYPQFPANHISNVQIGDKINTPAGIETVYWCDYYRFSTYKCDEKGIVIIQGKYGYVPYFESRNEEIFSIKK